MINAIQKVKTPTNIAELRSFLGLVKYYAKFVPNIGTILAPLYNLLKKGSNFNWGTSCNQAFEKVKSMLVTSPVLAHYLPLTLTTDASSLGVAAVI